MGRNEIDILETISYSDVFDYPLTLKEVWRFLISDKARSMKSIKNSLNNLSNILVIKNNFILFPKREQIIVKRLEKEKIGEKKLDFARKIASYISTIPSICFIGISGNLALKNSNKYDDIDFFIITSKNRIWITRLTIIFFLKILGCHRKKTDREVTDKICLNMLVDEKFLTLPKLKQNLYTAHEIIQLFPIFERNNTYKKFILANKWVKKYLPNSLDIKISKSKNIENKSLSILISKYLNILFMPLEIIAKKVQLRQINKCKTNEIITDHLLAFHPYDYSSMVLSAYKKRIKKYEKT